MIIKILNKEERKRIYYFWRFDDNGNPRFTTDRGIAPRFNVSKIDDVKKALSIYGSIISNSVYKDNYKMWAFGRNFFKSLNNYGDSLIGDEKRKFYRSIND